MEAQPLLAVVDHKPAPGTALPCCCCRRVRCCWCCCRIPRWGCVLLSIAAVLCVLATAATCVYFLVIHKHVPEYFPPSGPCPRACACRLRAPCFRGPHVCFSCVYLAVAVCTLLSVCVCVCGCVAVWLCVWLCRLTQFLSQDYVATVFTGSDSNTMDQVNAASFGLFEVDHGRWDGAA